METEKENRIYSSAVGSISTKGNWQAAFDKGYCKTGTATFKGEKFNQMVVSQHVVLLLKSYVALVDDDNTMHVPETNRHLDCSATAGQCQLARRSYYWNPPAMEPYCPLYQTRWVKGVTTEDEHARQVFTSTDGSMVRVLIKDKASFPACGADRVQQTNYHNLFLVSASSSNPYFLRKLPTREMSIVTYANNQDSFLYHDLKKKLKESHAATIHHDCVRRQQEQKQSLSGLVTEQVSLSEGISANLGNGYFASSAGDAYWRYKCKDILAYVRTTNRCYESVPVRLQPKDDYRYRKALKLDLNGTVEYFLTPHSHMLTTTGIEVECVHARPSMYLGAYGQWILIRPQGNSITTEPRAIELKGHTLEDDPPNDPNWEPLEAEYGGIYLPEDIRTMEYQRQRQRAEKDVSLSLGNAALERHWVGGQGTSYFHQGVGSFPLPGLPDFTGAS